MYLSLVAGTRKCLLTVTQCELLTSLSRGILLAARLKALGVDYLVIDKNAETGDNWNLRYDCLRFHVGKSMCEMPYLRSSSLYLDRDECFH